MTLSACPIQGGPDIALLDIAPPHCLGSSACATCSRSGRGSHDLAMGHRAVPDSAHIASHCTATLVEPTMDVVQMQLTAVRLSVG